MEPGSLVLYQSAPTMYLLYSQHRAFVRPTKFGSKFTEIYSFVFHTAFMGAVNCSELTSDKYKYFLCVVM